MDKHLLEKKYLFEFMLEMIGEVSTNKRLKNYEAFPRWFVEMYFQKPIDIIHTDGARDGKIDCIFKTENNGSMIYNVVNSKFSKDYNKTAPTGFYDEIIAFSRLFDDSHSRENHISDYVRKDLRKYYRKLFENYDQGKTKLFFITNCKKNINQYDRVKGLDVDIFHMNDILQHMVDDLEGAMPRTKNLILTGISNVLSPSKEETIVPTSIVFAKLFDFITYMREDHYDLLFARNIRLNLGKTEPNRNIQRTFKDAPKEFAFSNNGITILCERYSHDPGNGELLLVNPRVVNGSQTLHSVRDVDNPSKDARVMLRIIQIEPFDAERFKKDALRKKEIINKISIRSNLQNPIMKWNLAANDDFNQELKRYFRKQGYFYETRKNEWKSRRTELKSVNIDKGPFLPKQIQLLACYHNQIKGLGPANAYRSRNDLFEEDKAYHILSKTEPKIAFQLFLLDKLITKSLTELSNLQYIKNSKQYCKLSLFTIYIELIRAQKITWGSSKLSEILENESKYFENYAKWNRITKHIMNFLLDSYKKQKPKYLKTEGIDLTYNTYFKNNTFIMDVVNRYRNSKIVRDNIKKIFTSY